MVSIKKKLTSLFCILIISVSIISTPVYANSLIQPRAWPGRPGGNNGTEEWLQGNYGETNGPWKVICTQTGKVSDLNKSQLIADSVGMSIVSILSAGVFSGKAGLLATIGITGASIGGTLAGQSYSGNYYKMTTYQSGRCMRFVITTYETKNFTGYISTYEKLLKW